MRRLLGGALALAALAAPASAFAQTRPPWLRTLTTEQLPRPLPSPYDSDANARQQIAAAAARARTGNKRLLIDFGGNWCPECRVLAGIMALPEMRSWMARHYELVTVDIGSFDRNLDIPARFGVRLAGVPALFVVDPHSARLINRSEINVFEDGVSSGRRSISPIGWRDGRRHDRICAEGRKPVRCAVRDGRGDRLVRPGYGRTIDEIAGWGTSDQAERDAVMALLPARLAQLPPV